MGVGKNNRMFLFGAFEDNFFWVAYRWRGALMGGRWIKFSTKLSMGVPYYRGVVDGDLGECGCGILLKPATEEHN